MTSGRGRDFRGIWGDGGFGLRTVTAAAIQRPQET